MNFPQLQGNFLTLRRRLNLVAGTSAIDDINMEPPKGQNDELSFIRLVAWSYVLLHESGKISLNFLRRLPPWKGKELLPHVRALRTWTSHNLLFEKEHDVKVMRSAVSWFSATCGAGSPHSSSQWEVCFATLAGEVNDVLTQAISTCDLFSSPEEGSKLAMDLRGRLDKIWAAHRFDPYVEKAIVRLNYTGLDAVGFRNRYLEEWRKVISISAEEFVDRNLVLRMEADLIREMQNALPMTADELNELVDFCDEESLIAALIMLRNQPPHMRAGVHSRLVAARNGK